MSGWIQRVGGLFGGRKPIAAVAAPAPRANRPAARVRAVLAPSVAPVSPAVPGPESADPQLPFFEWLLDTGPTLDLPLQPNEHRLLARLDAVLAGDASRADLLPRAPAVIPQLMNSLRDERQSSHALAERVAKDPNLVAEVIRLANGTLMRAAEPVSDLAQAISRVGTQGLRRAIARVVLKPIFDAQPDSLSGRAAPRLWLHSEAKAAECMRLAAAAGLDPFEGYLAGLMHNVGWTAALRVLDRAQESSPEREGATKREGTSASTAQSQFGRAFVQAFETRREMFFAVLVIPWQLNDSLTALAVELRDGGLASRSALGQALRAADRHASQAMLDAASRASNEREAIGTAA